MNSEIEVSMLLDLIKIGSWVKANGVFKLNDNSSIQEIVKNINYFVLSYY